MPFRPITLAPLFFALLLTQNAYARYTIEWAAKPIIHKIPDSLKSQPAVFVLEEKVVEMETLVRGNKFSYKCYRSIHHIVHLNDNAGVDAFNTFTLAAGENPAADAIKARTILPDGRTVEVGRERIKQIKDEDGEVKLKLALEQVELGCEVELIFTQEIDPSSEGVEVYQFSVPVQQAVFRLIVPEDLRYDMKGYNGFPTPTDSVAANKHFYIARASDIPSLLSEPYSRYEPMQMRVDYKLSFIAGGESTNVRRATWAEYAKGLYNIYSVFSSSEEREAARMLETIGVKSDDDDLKKALAIEDYFKTNIRITSEADGKDAAEFRTIARSRQATERNYMRFFVACIAAAGIRYEVGIAGSRYRYGVDEELEMWNRLDDYVLWFPTLKSYMAPAAMSLRYPYIPYRICGAKAMFTKTTTLGSMVSALPDMRTLPHTSMAQNVSRVDAEVHFESGSMTPHVQLTHSLMGYPASGLNDAFLFAPADKQKELVQQMSDIAARPDDVDSFSVKNAAYTSYSEGKPLEVAAAIQSPALMEKAGPKYLFKIGAIIGRQSELYQEKKRSLPIELEFPHSLPRVIRVHIPEGYTVVNPETVRMRVLYDSVDKEACGFTSDFTTEGNEFVVNVREYYRDVSYPVEGYEAFRRVINAAADFNKAVLILQKK